MMDDVLLHGSWLGGSAWRRREPGSHLIGKQVSRGSPDPEVPVALRPMLASRSDYSIMCPPHRLFYPSAQILEACIKNAFPAVYGVLAKSELWVELMKMAADKSVGRVRGAEGMGRCSPQRRGADSAASLSLSMQVDAEVRDRILCMAEDYAKVLPLAEFRESYELLLVRRGGGGGEGEGGRRRV